MRVDIYFLDVALTSGAKYCIMFEVKIIKKQRKEYEDRFKLSEKNSH